MINEEFFQSLSEEHQKMILQGADLYTRTANAHSYATSLTVKSAMEAKGAKFYYPTAAEIAQFKELGQQPYIETIVSKIGDDGQQWVDKVIAAAAAADDQI